MVVEMTITITVIMIIKITIIIEVMRLEETKITHDLTKQKRLWK